MTTELVYWDPEEQKLQAPFYSSDSNNKISLTRPAGVTCMDINEDGVIEIPAARPFEGNAAASNTVMPAMDERAASSAAPAYITQWQQYFPRRRNWFPFKICMLIRRRAIIS